MINQGWDAWSSEPKNAIQRDHQGNSRRWKFKEGPQNAPSFLVSLNTPCWKSRTSLQPQERGDEKTGSWGQRGEGNLSSVFLGRENTEAPGTRITDNCWRNASLPSLSSVPVTLRGTWTGKLPMIGFIRAIFRKMSEVNSSAIIPLQGSNNCYQECKWVKKKKKKRRQGKYDCGLWQRNILKIMSMWRRQRGNSEVEN